MTSPDFAGAQARVLERLRVREAEAERYHQAALSALPSDSFPYPLNRASRAGSLVWGTIKGREGTRPAFRVGQVDAELLDDELLDLLKGQVGEALKYFGSYLRDDWSEEILLALRLVLFKLSIWDHDASYGAALQNLKYTDARKSAGKNAPPTTWQKLLYGIFTVGGRYGWNKWEGWLIDQEGGYNEPSENVRALSHLTSYISTTHSVAAFSSFLVFLVNGRYRTLVDRVLRMRLASPTSQVSREVSFEYLNRQLVWHAFTEFLLFLLPLVGIGRWRRWLSRVWRRTKTALRSSGDEDIDTAEKHGELSFLPERTCPICYQDQNPSATSENEIVSISAASGGIIGSASTDISNPYETIPCGCLYCFSCIAQRIEAEEGEGWICLRCGEIVKQCKPWNGDVLEEKPQSRSGKGRNVGFVEDVDDKGPANPEKASNQEDEKSGAEDAESGLQDSSQWSTVEKDSGGESEDKGDNSDVEK